MHLLSIELAGFKSFANRTRVRFEPGITGIVGPNGCGKSNIADALKWVLGTLSTKAMRADEMADVVFKGCATAPPAGFAEVILSFDNSDHGLSLDQSEVSISRRYYRSGESEFAINGESCRLKDIRELMAGTGIGPDTYAMIEQGKIDRLVLANPHDRRAVFDEAAGVSRYRIKRHEAQLRLARVGDDLARAESVLAEVEREGKGLRIQAGRAVKFRELEAELRDKTIRLLVLEAQAQETLLRQGDERRAAIGRAIEEAGSRRDALEAAVESARASAHEASLTAERLRAERAGLIDRAGELRAAVERAQALREQLSADQERANEEVRLGERRLEDLRRRLQESRAACETEVERVRSLAALRDEAAAKVRDARAECVRLSQEIEERRTEQIELARREAAYRNDAESARREAESARARARRLDERVAAFSKAQADLARQVEGLKAEAAQLQGELDRLGTERERADERARALTERLSVLEGDLARRGSEAERLESRRLLLAEWEAQREGLGSGARALLEEGPEGPLPGIVGPVAENLEVEWEHAAAVEAALGEASSFLLAADLDSAVRAAQIVRDRGLARTGLVPIVDGPVPERTVPDGNGIVGTAFDLVRYREDLRPALARLLAGTLVVKSLDDARALRMSTLWTGSMVTLDGFRLDAHGTVVSPGAGESAGLVARRSERRHLEGELERLRREMDTHRTEAGSMRADLAAARHTLEQARVAIYERNVRRHEVLTETEQIGERLRLAGEELAAANAEQRELEQSVRELEERCARVEALAVESAAVQARMADTLSERLTTLRRFEGTLKDLEEEANRHRIEAAKAAEKADAVKREVADLGAQASHAEEMSARAREGVGRIERRIVEAEREQGERERECAEARSRAERMEGEVSGAESARTEKEAERERLEGERGSIDEALAQEEESLHQLELELQEARGRVGHVAERMREEFGVEIADARVKCADAKVEERDALLAEVPALKERIQRYGAVNVLALERLKEVEERETFLRTQRDDLSESKRRIEGLIAELNEQAQSKFANTLKCVAEHFDDLFRRLFSGGKTEIKVVPEEGVDPSEWGVEIFAKVPKKEVTKLNLLSGGEKSLTAVALALSLFRANPSPFCVLDEADSALDEANVDRYAALVRDFATITQFIVVTHNKKTMASADLLYGVSMETPGVTKIVSVDFRTAEPVTA